MDLVRVASFNLNNINKQLDNLRLAYTRWLLICWTFELVPGGGVEPPRYRVPADFESDGSDPEDDVSK